MISRRLVIGLLGAGVTALALYATPVCTENLNPDVVAMKSAKDRI
jgi:hypothetical protein